MTIHSDKVYGILGIVFILLTWSFPSQESHIDSLVKLNLFHRLLHKNISLSLTLTPTGIASKWALASEH